MGNSRKWQLWPTQPMEAQLEATPQRRRSHVKRLLEPSNSAGEESSCVPHGPRALPLGTQAKKAQTIRRKHQNLNYHPCIKFPKWSCNSFALCLGK